MCKKATCSKCDKRSWWGCGQHIATVIDEVPEAERCTCEPKHEVDGKKYPPKADKPDAACAVA
ncbi:uncharacterized protein K489DRAFT_385523 [Dissoconium aciculare CBS 342.82]|uniref:Uncharacterized protein n=1 Tax=Dissoconium aciculare CBS 342.82 TaxID=1314786 RepID=A0A6J3LR99_9PEZI|nr:uncharacterized protein K489DRAFT_385523 [Dissoconium aciculare CBS 342.82]KAF1817799.1 hypothetical protein K489DRAFT_385523 [Dissoconium aciculare CBS 342.82]